MDIQEVLLTGIISFVLGIATILLWQKRANSSPDILSRRILEDLGLFGEGKNVTHAFTYGVKRRKEMAHRSEQDALRAMEECEKKIEQAQEEILEQLTEVTRAEEKIEDADTKGKRSILIQSELSRPLITVVPTAQIFLLFLSALYIIFTESSLIFNSINFF
mgnify:CR=1 FL=1